MYIFLRRRCSQKYLISEYQNTLQKNLTCIFNPSVNIENTLYHEEPCRTQSHYTIHTVLSCKTRKTNQIFFNFKELTPYSSTANKREPFSNFRSCSITRSILFPFRFNASLIPLTASWWVISTVMKSLPVNFRVEFLNIFDLAKCSQVSKQLINICEDKEFHQYHKIKKIIKN